MSNVVLQFGQCGNQVGHSLYEFLLDDIRTTKNSKNSNDYNQEALYKWFNVRKDFLEPKAILVDTEDKVTKDLNKGNAIKYRNVVSKAYGGSANNWAFGYNSQSLLVQEETLERLRREIERCDMLGCIINVLSPSGGTGSGVGMSWTEDEKTVLLHVLQKHGLNLEKISEQLPRKSISDIRSIINKYENLALQSLGDDYKSKETPLDKWIKHLRENSTRNGHNLISRVLNYIALFEKRVDGPVNLTDCYTVLAALTSGKPSKEMDVQTMHFLNECFLKLAKEVKNGNIEEEVKFLENIDLSKAVEKKTYKRKVSTDEIDWNHDTNVCKVPMDLLKISCIE